MGQGSCQHPPLARRQVENAHREIGRLSSMVTVSTKLSLAAGDSPQSSEAMERARERRNEAVVQRHRERKRAHVRSRTFERWLAAAAEMRYSRQTV